MLYIDKIWRGYFENHHEGLGTTYERFVLHDFFKKLQDRYHVENVLEAPSFGMTGVSGINSLWWACNGCKVTVCDSDVEREGKIRAVWKEVKADADVVHIDDYGRLPFRDRSYDLSWNFASLLFITSLETCLAELARVSSKVIFICVPNTYNVFHVIRSMRGSETQNVENINDKRIRSTMGKLSWQVVESGYLDVPPWPDIAMKKEDLLKKIGLSRKREKTTLNDARCLCILDYFSGKDPDMEKRIMKYGLLEHSPLPVRALWGHHRYYICVPAGTTRKGK